MKHRSSRDRTSTSFLVFDLDGIISDPAVGIGRSINKSLKVPVRIWQGPIGQNKRQLGFRHRSQDMEMTAVVTPAEEGGYIAVNLETGTTTQGDTVEEAIANLKEATTLYLSEIAIPAPGHPLVTTFSVPAHA